VTSHLQPASARDSVTYCIQGTLLTMLNLCHLTAFGSIYCLLSNSSSARFVYVNTRHLITSCRVFECCKVHLRRFYAFVHTHAASPLPALATPDRRGWEFPYYAELFWTLHILLALLPRYFVFVRAAPLVQHIRNQPHPVRTYFDSWCQIGPGTAFLLWFGVLAPIALATGNNLFYTLCPPGNLRQPFAFLGRAWSIVGHLSLMLIGCVYATGLIFVVDPVVRKLFNLPYKKSSRGTATVATSRLPRRGRSRKQSQ
jgi:hypothetical protein